MKTVEEYVVSEPERSWLCLEALGESSGEVQIWSRLWVIFRFRESRLWCTNTLCSVLEAKCCSSVGDDELFNISEVMRKVNWTQTKSSPGWEGYKNIPEAYTYFWNNAHKIWKDSGCVVYYLNNPILSIAHHNPSPQSRAWCQIFFFSLWVHLSFPCFPQSLS